MTELPYELKGMKELQTSDGVAFTANIYRGKKKIGTVENSGHGGPDRVWINADEEPAWDAWTKALETFRYAPSEFFPEGLTIDHPEESAVAHLMKVHDDAKERKWLDSKSKTKIIGVNKSAPEGQYILFSYVKGQGPAGTRALLPRLFEQFGELEKVWVVAQGWVPRP